MSENTGIQWTDHTFNPWSGCAKISPGCANCYAAALPPSMRRNADWGVGRDRAPASDSYWREPEKWNRAAEKAGERRRVFCASVADVFEARADLDPRRERLFALIRATPWLDWQLLTKRPEYAAAWWGMRVGETWPENAWIGTSVENQEAADERAHHLMSIPAAVRFLSCEPLLGAVDVSRWLTKHGPPKGAWQNVDARGLARYWHGIDWVIVGAESGHKARPFNLDWARSIIGQCREAGVACFVKQLGATPFSGDEGAGWAYDFATGEDRRWRMDERLPDGSLACYDIRHKKGGDPSEWPADLRVREMPS